MGRFITVTINHKDTYIDKSKIVALTPDSKGGTLIWLDGINDEFGVNEDIEKILDMLATK